MRSLTKKTIIIPAMLVLISAYVFASASLINLSKTTGFSTIENTLETSSYDLALFAEFNFDDEDYINDIPYSIAKEEALIDEFDFEDEDYINDIPAEVLEGTLS